MSENGDDPTLEVARQLSRLRRQLLDLRAHRRQSDELVSALQQELAALQDRLGVLRQEALAPEPPELPAAAAADPLEESLRRWLPRSTRGRARGRRS